MSRRSSVLSPPTYILAPVPTRELMLNRIRVTGVQLWPTQFNYSFNITYRSIESAAERMCKVGLPKFAPEIAS